jgi:hypothetical protein
MRYDTWCITYVEWLYLALCYCDVNSDDGVSASAIVNDAAGA